MLLFKEQRHCTHIPLWCWIRFTKAQLTGVRIPPPRHSTPFKQARSNQRNLSSGKQGAAKTSCQTGKEDKMVTSVPSGNLLFSPGCSTQPRLKSLQEMLPSPVASWLLCYPPPQATSTRIGQCVALAMYRDCKVIHSGWCHWSIHKITCPLPLSVASQAPELEECRWCAWRLHKKQTKDLIPLVSHFPNPTLFCVQSP